MDMQRRRGLCALFVVTGLITSSALVAPVAAGPNQRSARFATRYIVGRQGDNGSVAGFSKAGATADAILALSAARRSPKTVAHAIAYLRAKAKGLRSVGLKGKVAMAVVAAGRNPRSFGGRNLVRAIKRSRRESGRYGGTDSRAAVLNHALALLGLDAAGETAPRATVRWLEEARCPDRGWQYDAPSRSRDGFHCHDGSAGDFTRTDTNTTSYAVQALEATALVSAPVRPPAQLAGLRPSASLAYFRSARDHTRGGWRYSHQRRAFGSRVYTDANSTALVLQAYAAVDEALPRNGRRALRFLAYRPCGELTGAFAYTWARSSGQFRRVPSRADAAREDELGGPSVIGATVGAVLGLLQRPLPLEPVKKAFPAPPRRRCGA